MDTLYNMHVFSDHLINAKALFVNIHKSQPNCLFIAQTDYDKAFEYITTQLTEKIEHTSSFFYMNCTDKKEKREQAIIVMREGILVEIRYTFCRIFYKEKNDAVASLRDVLLTKKKREKRKPLEINLVTQSGGALYLTETVIKRTRLDIGSHYEDNFKDIDQLIQKRLNKKQDKGIVLLHGTPGTGKTTYLRYLIGKIKKKVLFLSPELAANITNPDLIQLLIDNPDSVLVIEDAENIIMQRQAGHSSGVSNLLNISDGLLSDFLNIQLICTFNSAVSTIDQALMRKGRLIARYEFGKLSVAKAQALSNKLGYETNISKPMSLAEIFNQKEVESSPERQLIGFRTAVMTN